ncbi:Kynurenine formamidase [Emydomyces testavorans]|uniref:Kynurenine formamidase n=1 Tax=Emydomyces testavorans TaxID=2070801 RepID=A0AAF0IPZ5_9EURO|nr:Kynurenine formamidase [Emydomyces testavorans]
MSFSISSDAPNVEHYHYGEQSALQDVYVYRARPRLDKEFETGYWIVYIHGGAWRDPEILAPTFNTTRQLICGGDPSIASEIVAFASINYRLTRHPNFPQDPMSIDPKQYRNAKHPDHLNDVINALAFLQAKYSFGERYVLVGHSCGATLAFQTVMQRIAGAAAAENKISQPLAIVGVSGIYDLRLLRDTHEHPAYQQFIEEAFGDDEEKWDDVSPARVRSGGVLEGWCTGRLAVLASSKGDELVDPLQLKVMANLLEQWKHYNGQNPIREVLIIDDLEESHDDIWKNGVELAMVISKTIATLKRLTVSN